MRIIRYRLVGLFFLFLCVLGNCVAQTIKTDSTCHKVDVRYYDSLYQKLGEYFFDSADYESTLDCALKFVEIDYDTTINSFLFYRNYNNAWMYLFFSMYKLGWYSSIIDNAEGYLQYYSDYGYLIDSVDFANNRPFHSHEIILLAILKSYWQLGDYIKVIDIANLIENTPYITDVESTIYYKFQCYIHLNDTMSLRNSLSLLWEYSKGLDWNEKKVIYDVLAQSSFFFNDEKSAAIYDSMVRDIDDTIRVHPEYIEFLNNNSNIIQAFSKYGKINELLDIVLKSIDNKRHSLEEIQTIINCATLYRAIGNPGKAWLLLETAIPSIVLPDVHDIATKIKYYELVMQANSIGANLDFENGEYDRAMEKAGEALRAYLILDADATTLEVIRPMASVYLTSCFRNEAFDSAATVYLYIVDMIDSLACAGVDVSSYHNLLIGSLSNLAYISEQAGNHKDGEKYIKRALEYYTRSSTLYIETLYSLGIALFEYGARYDTLTSQILEIILNSDSAQMISGLTNPDYAFLNQLLTLLYIRNNYSYAYDEKIMYHLAESTQSYMNYYKSHVLSSTTNSRKIKWEEIMAHFRTHVHRVVIQLHERHPEITTIGYNAALFSKGLLLEIEKSIKKIITDTGDTSIVSLYDTIEILKKQVAVSINNDSCTDSLYRRINHLEISLSEILKKNGNPISNLSISWEDIKDVLPSHSAAIEFCEDNRGGLFVYIMRYDKDYPIFLYLKYHKTHNDYLNLESRIRLSKYLWRPLEENLKGIDTIYFSPSGELTLIPIEYLPDYEDSTRLISDRYNLYRLSSTRELAKDKKKASIKNGSIYGGLRYDATIDTTLRGTDGQRSFTYFPWTSDSISASRGNKAAFLPGTLAEAKYIYDFMKRASINTTMYTDSLGTEFSFKQMSGSDVNLIQIGTHGFYYGGKQEVKSERESVVGEDKSMTRSGLLLAGANMTLKHGLPNSSTYNDGILTAAEIAQLDLKNVDMAVLSACETGLGELKGDGVFGLQRGFKKAGVNSIIMSLWKVDDRATQMLMTRFYDNWLIKKMPKQKALKDAQAYVRNYEMDESEWSKIQQERGLSGTFQSNATRGKKKKHKKGQPERIIKPYSDPKYWAAFILLDGLD